MKAIMRAMMAVVIFGITSICIWAQQPGPNCHGEKSHEFDFWIGHWQVISNGQLAGHNRIETILNGCVLQESWEGAQGSTGTSLNFYNPAKKRWEQFWVWRNGLPMHFKGNLVDGKMVLKGEVVSKNGKEHHRITWTPNPDGTVRQHWEKMPANQDKWQTLFDGLYTRVKSK